MTPVPPIVRSTGITELMGDIVLYCTAVSTATVTTDLKFTFDFPVTSRNYNPGSEIFLLIDEPNAVHYDEKTNTTYTPPIVPGVNLIQPDVTGPNSITFSALKLRIPEMGKPLIVRLMNVRGDMNGFPVMTTGLPSAASAFVTATAPLYLIDQKATVGFVQSGISGGFSLPNAGTPAGLCSGRNQALLTNPSASGGIIDLAVVAREGFLWAFKTRSGATAQNIPGQVFNSESGFFDPTLPVTNSYNRLGLADSPTRVRFTFSDIPFGYRLYITTTPLSTGANMRLLSSAVTSGVATTTASWNGASYGITPVTLTNGTAFVDWEVVQQDQFVIEQLSVGIILASDAGVTASLQPKVAVSFAEGSSGKVPRFSSAPGTALSLPFGTCRAGVDLGVAAVTASPGHFEAGRVQRVEVMLINRGNQPSGPFNYTVRLVSSADKTTELARQTVTAASPLQPGEARPVAVRLRPALTQSTTPVDLEAIVDEESLTADVDRTNNRLFAFPKFNVYCAMAPTGNVAASALGGYYNLPLQRSGCVGSPSGTPPSWISQPWSYAINVSPNLSPSPRRASVCHYVASTNCQDVSQASADPGCSYALSAGSFATVAYTGEIRKLTIQTSAPACRWSAVSNARMASPDAEVFTGTKTISVNFRPNFTPQVRYVPIAAGTWSGIIPQAGNPRPKNERIIQFIYYYFLGRLPSDAEVALQLPAMASMDLEDFIPRFFNALEFDLTSRYIAGLYVGLLNRTAEFTGFMYQRDALRAAVVNKVQLVGNFINSPEWALTFGAPDNPAFVRLLYQNVLLRQPAQAEVDFHVKNLVSGQTRTELARNFLDSEEFRLGTGAKLTAFLLYMAVLGRDTVSNEFDEMVNLLKSGKSVNEAISSLVGTPEFAGIFE